jgi:flagella basal body P-ring formation protein FlgA
MSSAMTAASRILAAAVVALAVSVPAFADETPRPFATLKGDTRVDAPQIVLGDLFDGAEGHAAEPVAAAPAPGGLIVFNANWLVAIAQSHGISWRAPSPSASIRVERAAIEVTADDLAKRLAEALDAEGPEKRVVLDNTIRLFAPTGGPPDIGVDRLAYDRDTNRFTAEIRVPASDPGARPIHVSGRIQTMVQLAVLTRAVMPGDVIRAEDVSTDWMRVELAPLAGVADPQTLIGKTPRRPLRAGQALRPGDVALPIVVKRNDLVLIVLEQPGMYLTAQGKALEDGGQGGVIRVTNLQSNRTIEAVVQEPGKVAVAPPSVAQATW